MSDLDAPSLPLSALTPIEEAPVRRMSTELEAALAGAASKESRFRVGDLLGKGASSEVVALEDRVLRRTLALKRMRIEHVDKLGNAFLREARLLASLDHPAIPAVYDYGIDSGGRPFLVMQRFAGEHLGRVLRDRGPIRSGVALQVLLEQVSRIASALDHAHRLGYLHLDLKPGNLVTGPFDQLWLVDWGNALHKRHWDRCFGRPVGTLSYMSPDQCKGGPFDVRTDVYGLGACLFTVLTGQPPHRGPRQVRINHLLGDATVPPIHPSVAALIPESLLQLAYACMAPHPDDRPATAAELKDRLDQCRRGMDLLPRRFAAADTLLAREGDPGDTAWYVVKGAVDVVQEGRGRIRTVGPGEVVGELAPVLRRNRTATLRTREDSILAVITGEALRDDATMGPIGAQLFKAIAERMLDAERTVKASGA